MQVSKECWHNRYKPKNPQSLPPTVVVEHVLISGTEHGDDGEDTFSRPVYQLLDRRSSL